MRNGHKQLLSPIKELEYKLSYIRNLLASRQLAPEDFREMKAEYTAKLVKLEAVLGGTETDNLSIDHLLDNGVSNLLKLDEI